MQNQDSAVAVYPFAATAALRETMVERQIRTFDVSDLGVQERMRLVPREIFVDPAHESLAYSDARLTVTGAAAREISAPLIIARLLKEARLRPGEKVLVVGGASGYAAALAAGMVGQVVSLDSDAGLTAKAQVNFAALNLANVKAVTGPLEQGAAADGPFDLVLIDGVSQGKFDSLYGQIADGGRLVGIVGDAPGANVGKATIFARAGGNISARVVFDASASAIDSFAQPAEFVF